jgi:hypothetical protein
LTFYELLCQLITFGKNTKPKFKELKAAHNIFVPINFWQKITSPNVMYISPIFYEQPNCNKRKAAQNTFV